MGQELFNDGSHICVVFRDLIPREAVQANQVMVFDQDHAALIDPGGELTYARLSAAMSSYLDPKRLDYVVASHQDPDVVGSIDKWLEETDCKAVIPSLWERFIPHLTRPEMLTDRVIPIPDAGLNLPLGDSHLKALPAHFLHAEGNYSFYDPVSCILFSGDIGANLPPEDLERPVTGLDEILPHMEGFHRRYMNSNRVCRYWVQMIRGLDVELMVPQHGRALKGRTVVAEFLGWLENLECGIDLVNQGFYQVPQADA